MLQTTDFKLTDLLGVAGSTIGIIIAGAILLGGFDAKYVGLFERYRALTGEFRGDGMSDPRRSNLHCQIDNYRRRLSLMNIASLCISLALFSFVVTVGVAGLSVMYPQVLALRSAGAVGLCGGLALIAAAVALNLVEIYLSRQVIAPEVADLSDEGCQEPPKRPEQPFTAADQGRR